MMYLITQPDVDAVESSIGCEEDTYIYALAISHTMYTYYRLLYTFGQTLKKVELLAATIVHAYTPIGLISTASPKPIGKHPTAWSRKSTCMSIQQKAVPCHPHMYMYIHVHVGV